MKRYIVVGLILLILPSPSIVSMDILPEWYTYSRHYAEDHAWEIVYFEEIFTPHRGDEHFDRGMRLVRGERHPEGYTEAELQPFRERKRREFLFQNYRKRILWSSIWLFELYSGRPVGTWYEHLNATPIPDAQNRNLSIDYEWGQVYRGTTAPVRMEESLLQVFFPERKLKAVMDRALHSIPAEDRAALITPVPLPKREDETLSKAFRIEENRDTPNYRFLLDDDGNLRELYQADGSVFQFTRWTWSDYKPVEGLTVPLPHSVVVDEHNTVGQLRKITEYTIDLYKLRPDLWDKSYEEVLQPYIRDVRSRVPGQ